LGDAILGELIDQGTGQDVIEELIELTHHCGLRCVRPCATPENRKHLDRREEWPVAIRELDGGRCRDRAR